MRWSEEGVILSVRRHGESAAIAEVFTRGQGRYLGLVRGGRSRALRPVLQPGNLVAATWRARLDEQLGILTVEPVRLQAGHLLDHSFRLAGLTTLAEHARVIPEREPHPRLYDAFRVVLDTIEDDALWPALLVRWELGLLDELGFGLDLARCAATGAREDLVYVSPKSGRAVSAAAGGPYRERLLPLPAFLLGRQAGAADPADIRKGFALTGFFLDRHVWAARGIAPPQSRARVITGLGY